MKKIISLFVVILLLTACSDSKYKTITTNEALELIDNGAIVIDVSIESITYDKNETLIIYCASGVRSTNAVNKLVDMGYTSLYNLDGGLLNWGSNLEE